MLAVSHALIGASIAKLVPNPIIGIPLSLASHFLGDLTPHWDMRTRKTTRSIKQVVFLSLTDAFIGYALGFWLFYPQVAPIYLMAMMFAAQFPDWLEAPFHVFSWNFPPFSSIKRLQSKLHYKMDLPWGLVIQLAIALAFVLITL